MIMKYSIIIPCYNEEENLKNLIDAVVPIISRKDVEFILVENGSTDRSRVIFEKEIEGKYKNIKVVYVDENKGYGYGLRQGIISSSGKYIGWIHADLQVNPLILHDYFNQIEYFEKNNMEKVFLKAQRSNRHLIEYFFSFGMGIYESMVFRKRMKEVMATPVLFNKSLIKDHIEDIPFDFSIDIYIYALAVNNNYLVNHLPVVMKDREAGDSSWNTGLISRIKLSKKMMSSSIKLKNRYF